MEKELNNLRMIYGKIHELSDEDRDLVKAMIHYLIKQLKVKELTGADALALLEADGLTRLIDYSLYKTIYEKLTVDSVHIKSLITGALVASIKTALKAEEIGAIENEQTK